MTTTQSEFDQLYHDYYPRIATYLSHMLGNHEDAEDLAQETFLNVARALPDLVPDHTAAWISRIATNTARDALRQRAIARLYMSHLDFETATAHLATDENPETLYVASEQFWQAWQRLPRQYQAVLSSLITGETQAELAQERGVSSVKSTLYHTRSAFRQAYEEVSA